jgi:hypothetical protein
MVNVNQDDWAAKLRDVEALLNNAKSTASSPAADNFCLFYTQLLYLWAVVVECCVVRPPRI